MRRWHSALPLLLCCAASLAMGHASAQPAPQQKLNQTQAQLQQTKQQEAKLKKELESTRADLSTMRERATSLAQSLQQSEAETDRAQAKLAKVSQELSVTEREFAVRKQEYAHTVAGLLRMRQLPPTAMFADEESLGTMLRTGRAMQHTNTALAERAKALRAQMERIQRLRREADGNKAAVERNQKQLAEKQKQLAADMATRQRLQAKLERDHADAVAQTQKLSRESATLQELIGKLESARATPQFAQKSAPAQPNAPLASAKGRLKLPVTGTVKHRFGDRKNANETYRGLVFAARPGATVVAPYQGEVVFTGPFMDYGRMVLVKHGDGYITLLAGLGSIQVGLNQRLNSGEPLGTMPTGNAQLYVEVRERSKPIDPAGWFANLPRK